MDWYQVHILLEYATIGGVGNIIQLHLLQLVGLLLQVHSAIGFMKYHGSSNSWYILILTYDHGILLWYLIVFTSANILWYNDKTRLPIQRMQLLFLLLIYCPRENYENNTEISEAWFRNACNPIKANCIYIGGMLRTWGGLWNDQCSSTILSMSIGRNLELTQETVVCGQLSASQLGGDT